MGAVIIRMLSVLEELEQFFYQQQFSLKDDKTPIVTNEVRIHSQKLQKFNHFFEWIFFIYNYVN